MSHDNRQNGTVWLRPQRPELLSGPVTGERMRITVFRLSPLALTLAALHVGSALASDDTSLDAIVVTAPTMATPLTVSTDPKAPRQPVPAHDGADLLKSIPGFSVIRKGGTDGDPVFRGMAASRLGILLDGETILGGCGMRMDPPTAYVFPESYDKVVVQKGPQTVLYGPGNSAGLVRFERATPRFDTTGARFDGSLLVGSNERNDQVVTAAAGTPRFYADAAATRSDANDYEDGSGREIHSAYTRWSTNLALGWTPDSNTLIELSMAKSDGEAAYADRSMDGVKFDRENVGLKFEKRMVSPLVAKIEAQVYRNYVDHVMDNYSLRTATGMKMVSNPDRETVGGRIATTLNLGASSVLDLGIDAQKNDHSLRSASSMMGDPDYTSLARTPDMRFRTWGVFGELAHELDEANRLIGGMRIDQSSAEDLRAGKTTSGTEERDTLKAGFLRWERALAAGKTLYAGIGHSERAADYWERNKNPEAISMMMTGSASTFSLAPEKTTQLDLGALHRAGPVQGSVSLFYAKHQDYILIEQLPGVSSFASNARNIDATTYGLESDVSYQFSARWKGTASLAWVHGDNDTDDTPLAQMPPLEGRLGLEYDTGTWSAGALWRLVSGQHRVDIGAGNVVGQDIGTTAGFGVFSINAGYRLRKDTLVSAGIDNVFDKTYAEHISRSGALINGYEQTTRVNEPGRTFWLKARLAL